MIDMRIPSALLCAYIPSFRLLRHIGNSSSQTSFIQSAATSCTSTRSERLQALMDEAEHVSLQVGARCKIIFEQSNNQSYGESASVCGFYSWYPWTGTTSSFRSRELVECTAYAPDRHRQIVSDRYARIHKANTNTNFAI